MKSRGRVLLAFFSLAGGTTVMFVALPLLNTLLATDPKLIASALQDAEIVRSLGVTFGAAALATLIACSGGLPLAYLLARRRFWGKSLVEAVINLPIVIPHTAAGIALLLVFSSRGILGRFLAPFGLFFTDHFEGIVVAMLFVSLPYLVNMSREAITQVNEELENMAMVEGANRWQALLHVTFPLAWRGIMGGAVMMWARGISEFGSVVILAYHPKVIPVLIFERFQGFGLQAAQPVAVILIVTVLLIFGLLRWVLIPEK